jgi:hypothetical protein
MPCGGLRSVVVLELRNHLVKKARLALLLAMGALLAGCDGAPPVVLNASQSNYFGSWEHVGNEYGNNIVSDNMLLIFHPDSTVSYKRCVNRMNGYSYTKLPEATIKSLADNHLLISAGVWKLRWTKDLRIDRAPYVDGDESYLEIDGLKLRRLRAGESSTHETWKCSDEEDQKER